MAGYRGDGAGTKNGCLKDGTVSVKLVSSVLPSPFSSIRIIPNPTDELISKVFSPTQPNSCPYLTNVGATKVYPGHTVYEPESAVVDPKGHPYSSAFSSGGGFSNIFDTPSYQQAAVAAFFKNHDPPYPYYTNGNYNNSNGLYNRNGRGIPDVAANGMYYHMESRVCQ